MKNKGVTLIETLVVVTILSVLALSLYTAFKSGIDAWSKAESRLDIYQNARAILDQLSRELPGAFVGGTVTFEGQNGATGSADTLTFVTEFADKVYRIRYYIDATNPAAKILKRGYIEIAALADYASTTYTYVDLVSTTKNVIVDDLQFKYLLLMTTPTGMNDWSSSAIDTTTGATLPEAVRIILTLRDPNDTPHSFETIVYLPNSEVE